MSKNITVINLYGLWIFTTSLVVGKVVGTIDSSYLQILTPVLIYNTLLLSRIVFIGLLK